MFFDPDELEKTLETRIELGESDLAPANRVDADGMSSEEILSWTF